MHGAQRAPISILFFFFFSSFLVFLCVCVYIGTRNQIDFGSDSDSYTYMVAHTIAHRAYLMPTKLWRNEEKKNKLYEKHCSQRSAAGRFQKYNWLLTMWVYVCARTLKVATAQHKSNWKLTKIALKCYFEQANNEMKRNREKKKKLK